MGLAAIRNHNAGRFHDLARISINSSYRHLAFEAPQPAPLRLSKDEPMLTPTRGDYDAHLVSTTEFPFGRQMFPHLLGERLRLGAGRFRNQSPPHAGRRIGLAFRRRIGPSKLRFALCWHALQYPSGNDSAS